MFAKYTITVVLLAILLVGIDPVWAQTAATVLPPPDGAPPAWLTGILGLLFNALGLGAGGVGATLTAGILWQAWSFVKAKAQKQTDDNTADGFARLAKSVEQGVFARLADKPPVAGEVPKLDGDATDSVVNFVKAQFGGNPGVDSDVIRGLAKSVLGRIVAKT